MMRTFLMEHWKKMGVISIVMVVFMGCCNLCFPNWYFLIPGGRTWYQEHLDAVLGEAELIVGAKYGVLAAKVSPDGRWLMARLNEGQPKRAILVNLETRELYRLDKKAGEIQWLDNNHVYIGEILRVPDLVWWPLENRNPDVDSLDALVGADHIFAMDKGSWTRLVTVDPDLPYAISVNWDGEELETHLANIPHTIHCLSSKCPVGIPQPGNQERYDSPDGNYYVERARHPNERYQTESPEPVIFNSQTGERVAHIYKWEDGVRTLGWAGDTSGVYLEIVPRGEFFNQEREAHPIYKLLVPGATLGPPLKEVPLPPGSEIWTNATRLFDELFTLVTRVWDSMNGLAKLGPGGLLKYSRSEGGFLVGRILKLSDEAASYSDETIEGIAKIGDDLAKAGADLSDEVAEGLGKTVDDIGEANTRRFLQTVPCPSGIAQVADRRSPGLAYPLPGGTNCTKALALLNNLSPGARDGFARLVKKAGVDEAAQAFGKHIGDPAAWDDLLIILGKSTIDNPKRFLDHLDKAGGIAKRAKLEELWGLVPTGQSRRLNEFLDVVAGNGDRFDELADAVLTKFPRVHPPPLPSKITRPTNLKRHGLVDADMEHFVDAHTHEYLNIQERLSKGSTTLWPEGTTIRRIRSNLQESLNKLADGKGELLPNLDPRCYASVVRIPTPGCPQKVTLDSGITVVVGVRRVPRDGQIKRMVRQFYPIGEELLTITRQEMNAIWQIIGP
jgi:hypothetical protein